MSGIFVNREDTEILSITGMRGESLVYEGCQGLLDDGRVCALGVAARRARQAGLYHGGASSRSCVNHTC